MCSSLATFSEVGQCLQRDMVAVLYRTPRFDISTCNSLPRSRNRLGTCTDKH